MKEEFQPGEIFEGVIYEDNDLKAARAIPSEHVVSIMEASIFKFERMGKTTVAHCTLPNGFEIVTTSTCVDPEKYDQKIGEEITKGLIQDRIFEFEAYRLHALLAEEDE